VAAGQFAGEFATLFRLHTEVSSVLVTGVLAERASNFNAREGLDGVVESFESLLESDVDAVAIFTQRWTRGPLAVAALRAGERFYSAFYGHL
jgi:predicted dehydrogenase